MRIKEIEDHWMYLAAWQACQPMVSVCCTDLDDFDEQHILHEEIEVLIPCERWNPEKVVEKQYEKECLSPDAKVVLNLIFNPPPELENKIYSKNLYRDPNERKLKIIMREKFAWAPIKVNRTFKELHKYVREL